ncbi:MAG TPA: glycosyltransferase [Bacteroidales bacterium]|nr:glycosyltransferase [Bacteroidales bacterium]
MKIVILGLSITSSWGNGHATTYRSLSKGLHKRGHEVVFMERDVYWYASNRDMPDPEFCRIVLYNSVEQLKQHIYEIQSADCVILGSYVPDGIEIGELIIANASGTKAFYDIDTPVTLAALAGGKCSYISPSLIPKFDIYLSFSGGPCLEIFEKKYGSPASRQLFCSVDPELYFPAYSEKKWDLGYLGTYSDDRQPVLNELLVEPARKWPRGNFIVAGPQYPVSLTWPENVKRIEHLPPALHNDFYNAQRFTLNVTRSDMVRMGYSPSVRLFEAAACAIPVISDWWEGIDTIFKPDSEIFISKSNEDTLRILVKTSENQRTRAGENARQVVLENHTGEQRASELEDYISESIQRRKRIAHVNAPV